MRQYLHRLCIVTDGPGLIEITALSDEIVETRRELHNHFSAILEIIDTLVNDQP